MIELEKKWLLKEIPKIGKMEGEFEFASLEVFKQSYISSTERVRYITKHLSNKVVKNKIQFFIKTPVGEGASIEEMTEMSMEEYNDLIPLFKKQLEKIRTSFLHIKTGLMYEFDYITPNGIFHNEHNRSSLVVLEIEFQNKYKTMEEVNANFTLPEYIQDYVLMDVTGDFKFSNYNLAKEINEVSRV